MSKSTNSGALNQRKENVAIPNDTTRGRNARNRWLGTNLRTLVRCNLIRPFDGQFRAVDEMMAASSITPANDDFHKLLIVVKDLAHQLDENRQATTKLKLHADLLKVLPEFGSLCPNFVT